MLVKNITISIDDGHKLDLKVAELLRKYKLKGIFFIPNNIKGFNNEDLLNETQIKELSKEFEIGGHTLNHPEDMKALSWYELDREIRTNKVWLEWITGKQIDYFCYPSGRYNKDTILKLKELGYKKARTTITGNIDKPEDRFRIKTSVHVYPENIKHNKPNFLENAKQLFDKCNKDSHYHIWGHSWEIDKFKMWDEFEELLKYITK